jgi:anti-sigma-K factor RskA
VADPLSPEDRIVLAGEVALGLLEGEARAEALRLQLADRDFAAEVERWSSDFAGMAHQVEAAEVSAGLWRAIAARLDRENPSIVERALQRWRTGALLAGAIAASLALVLLLRPAPALVPQPVAIAQLTGTSGAALAARYDPLAGTLRIRADAMPASRLAPELWVIPADGVPRSLGLVAARGSSEVAVVPKLRNLLAEGATLAITMEEPSTAPHAAPGSAPVAAGKISIL